MKIKILEDEAKSITIEFEDVDRSIPDLICGRLQEDSDVDFAAVVKEHPETGKPKLIVRSGKNAKKLVLKAVEEVQDQVKELAAQLPKK